MTTRSCDMDVCTKQGVLMTCYVNGRKRFRAAMMYDIANAFPSNAMAESGVETQSAAISNPKRNDER